MKKQFLFIILLLLGFHDQIKAQYEEPFVGQITFIAFERVPTGWAECKGQLMSIQNNTALYSILGTRYGGDGIHTFALPNLQGRVMLHAKNTNEIGKTGGEEAHTLSVSEMPMHVHTLMGTTENGNTQLPTTAIPANTLDPDKEYRTNTSSSQPNMNMLASTGNGQAHDNMQPYIVFKCIIATTGIYPSRN